MNSFGKEIKTTQIHTTMKNLKNILSIFAVLGIFATGAFAQESADVAVSATVVADLTVSADQDIALGTIQTGATSTINAGPDDVTATSNIGIGATYGIVRINGNVTTSVDIDFENATVDNGSDALTFTTSVFDSAGAATVADQGDLTTDASGNLTLYVGGTLAAPSGTGTYNTSTGSGDPITFTITYN